MFGQSTGPTDTGHVDLQSSKTIDPAHLVEMARRSVGRSDVLIELALAWTVVTRPYVAGTRGLARWAGMSDKTVREAVASNGATSRHGYLWTQTRGTASPTPEDRESMEIRFNTRTDYRSTSKKISTSPSSPSLPASKKEGREEMVMGNAVVSAPIGERAREALAKGLETLATLDEMNRTHDRGYVLTALDPGLDLWAEIEGEKPKNAAVQPLGRRAWALAVMCGLEDAVLSTEDVAALLGLSKRGAQDLLARLKTINPFLVGTVRQGRSIVYEIRWASNYRKSGDGWETCWTDDQIRKARASKDAKVQERSARRGTPAGYLAYRLSTANSKRDEYLADNPLPADADPAWVALVEEGDELKLHTYLVAKEAEAGSVPSTAEALDAPVEPEPVEEPVLVVAARQDGLRGDVEAFRGLSEEERRNRLVEMRRWVEESVVAPSMAAPSPQPAPVDRERRADETEDDHILRVICEGRKDLFRNIHGRLPNQPRHEPTARELTQRRMRQAAEERRRDRTSGSVR